MPVFENFIFISLSSLDYKLSPFTEFHKYTVLENRLYHIFGIEFSALISFLYLKMYLIISFILDVYWIRCVQSRKTLETFTLFWLFFR